MSIPGNDQVYDALALPNEALTDGGVEILRAGIIKDELYVMARRAFRDPARWGEVLADIARRIALYHSAEDTSLTEQQILIVIEQAFAADLGATKVASAPRAKISKGKAPKGKSAKAKAPPAKRKTAKKAPPKGAKRKKR
jgi:hypothetical protein